MDPIMAYSGYTPSSMALPGMMSRTEQMMMPYMSSWNDYVTQLEMQNLYGNTLNSLPCATQTGDAEHGNSNSVFNMQEHLARLAAQEQIIQQNQLQQQAQARQYMRAQRTPLINMKTAAEDLQRKIVHNEQSQIADALAKYKLAVKVANYAPGEDVSDEDLMGTVRDQYKVDTGHDLIEEIQMNGNSSFAQGFINSILFGCFGQQSAEETISNITGQKVDNTEKEYKNAGTLASVATYATIGATIGGFCGVGVFSPVTAVVGGAIGTLVGGISAFVGHNRHNK